MYSCITNILISHFELIPSLNLHSAAAVSVTYQYELFARILQNRGSIDRNVWHGTSNHANDHARSAKRVSRAERSVCVWDKIIFELPFNLAHPDNAWHNCMPQPGHPQSKGISLLDERLNKLPAYFSLLSYVLWSIGACHTRNAKTIRRCTLES